MSLNRHQRLLVSGEAVDVCVFLSTQRIQIEPKRPDAQFRDQFYELQKLGFGTSIVRLEDLGEGICGSQPRIPARAMVVYRGWMLTPTQYEKLVALIRSHHASPLVPLEIYLPCHYLPNWYPLVSEFTAETKIFPVRSDLADKLKTLG
jgi:hypothetical protein